MNTELHHLAAAYALGALDSDERDAFEVHYPNCDVCSNEVLEFSLTAAILAERTLINPRQEVRVAVMDRISKTRQFSPLVESPGLSTIPAAPTTSRVPTAPGPASTTLAQSEVAASGRTSTATSIRSRPSKTGRAVFAAAAALLLIVGGAIVVGRRTAEPDLFAQLLEAPDAEVTSLEGETGTLQVVWSPSMDRVAVLGSSLPDPGPGMTYELWFLVEGGVARAGLFAPEASGEVRHTWEVNDLDSNGWGVTIEPLGGSDSPTSEVLYVGEL